MKILLLYSDVNKFYALHIIFTYSFFSAHATKEPVMSSVHKQCITDDCWIYDSKRGDR